MSCSRKYSFPQQNLPNPENVLNRNIFGFENPLPHCSGNSNLSSYLYFIILAFTNPLPLEFSMIFLGSYGRFLEWHIYAIVFY